MTSEIISCGIDEIDQYTEDVLTGKIPTNKWVKLAIERNQRDLRRAEEDPDFPYYFEPKAAQHFFDFCESHIKHYEGIFKGKVLKLEPWQKTCFGLIFGWLHEERINDQPIRRFKTADIFVPKKNGKSFVGAAIALYCMFWDDEAAAQVYSLAINRSHAKKLSYNAATKIIENSSELSKLFKINKSIADLAVKCPVNQSKFEPLSSKPETTDGLNVHCAICDEIKDIIDPEIYDVIEMGTASRVNSLILNITTAGANTTSLGFQRQRHAEKVLDERVEDDHSFAMLYGIDEGDEENWDKEEVWMKANPNYGVSVRKSYFETAISKAKHNIRKKNEFLTKHLNVWGRSTKGWIDISNWDDCGDDNMDMEEYSHLPALITVDLSSQIDLTTVMITFFEGDSASELKIYPFTYAYLPQERFTNSDTKYSDRYKSQLKSWKSQGYIEIAGDQRIDYKIIKDKVLELFEDYNISKISYDPYQAGYLANELMDAGISVDKLMKYNQNSYKLFSEPMDHLEAMIIDKKVVHNKNPLLRWCMGNVNVKTNSADLSRPDKISNDEKIDAAVCLIMAVGTYMYGVQGEQKEERKLNPIAARIMQQEGKDF